MSAEEPVGIIDIGSNSVRLVVYSGLTRSPSTLFNEKVMAGLGEGLARTGELDPAAQETALAALRRFRLLTRQMGIRRPRVVATAAVRDAGNGEDFLRAVRASGFDPEVLSGEEEARMAGLGVISAFPGAEGIVGDLGGGSLELVEVAGGRVLGRESLPLGVLRLPPLLAKGEGALTRKVAKAIEASGLGSRGRKKPFYMVGGSWRALGRLDMLLTDYPLPITHHYRMLPDRPAELHKAIAALDRLDLKNIPSLPLARMPALPGANLLLKALSEMLRPSELIVSSFGIREGLIFDHLPGRIRRLDPLIDAARAAARGLGRFDQHGDLLDSWIGVVFDDPPETARLRLTACLLSDIAWRAHPDFRAERGVDIALHGNWVGIDGPGRVLLAQALFTALGGGKDIAKWEPARLCSPAQLERAAQWGLAMRLGQRLSGGAASALRRTRLARADNVLRLELRKGDEALYGETVERRLAALAASLRLKFEAVAT